jgi:hypothetical protein
MANHHPGNGNNGNGRNGRSVALPDENRPSWRPQDEQHRARRAMSEEDDRYEEDRYGRHWEDRGERYGDRYDRSDRSYGFESRNQGYPGSFEDRHREHGPDEHSSGRGGSAYYERGYERMAQPRGYGYGDGGERPNLGTGGLMHGGQSSSREHWSPREGSTGYSSGHRGKGPSGYQRSDERIREIICEALTDDDRIDASNIEVSVKGGEVTLSGSVKERTMKRAAEELVEGISGVKEVQNQIRYRS